MQPLPVVSDRLVTSLLDAWNAHDVEAVVTLHAPDFEGEDVAVARPLCGHAALRDAVEAYLGAFPDLQVDLRRVLRQEGGVVLVWTAYGTHLGPLLHIPPTGRRVAVRGVWILDLASERVRRCSAIWDVAGLLRDLGLLPRLNLNA